MSHSPIAVVRLYSRSRAAVRHATARGAPGLEFDRFGRKLGGQLLYHGIRSGFYYMVNPVSSVRYFEFPFALAALPPELRDCLDVSSPRLFSFYVASHYPTARVLMANPDERDIGASATHARCLGLGNVQTRHCGLDELAAHRERYDAIWSISVIEHVSGAYDDHQAVQWLYGCLKPGGRLILTVPVDRQYRVEYRDRSDYGIQIQTDAGKYFFQRVYDRNAIWERLLSPIGREPSRIGWFGECVPGHYAEYEQRWLRDGLDCTVDDPREIVDHYQEFRSWEEMPGLGICGLVIDKP